MNKKIAVDNNLNPVKEYLQSKGYDVVNLYHNNNSAAIKEGNYQAIVISGLNDNPLGYSQDRNNTPVIKANGMTPQEVYNQIKEFER